MNSVTLDCHPDGRTGGIHSHIATANHAHTLTLAQRHHVAADGSLVVGGDLMQQVSGLAHTS